MMTPSQDFDLNLAPIIDCFVVLIAFVMISSAFASIAILDAGVSAGGDSVKSMSPSVQVTISLRSDFGATLKIASLNKIKKTKGASEIVFPATHGLASGEWPPKLTDALIQLKRDWPELHSATLVADNSVPYQSVVNAMDLVRKYIPDVLLGGF